MSLKLGPIPDRTPVKLNLSLAPDVHEALTDYAAIHKREYGNDVKPGDVAGLMIEKFLESDIRFKKLRKSFEHPLTPKGEVQPRK